MESLEPLVVIGARHYPNASRAVDEEPRGGARARTARARTALRRVFVVVVVVVGVRADARR